MKQKLFTFLCLCILCIGSAWGEDTYVELCTSWNKTLAYATEYTQDYSINDLNGGVKTMTLGVQGVFRNAKNDAYFQMNKKTGYFKNTTKLPGKITKIETTWNVAKGPTKCYFAQNAEATSTDATVTVTSATSVTYTPDDEADYYYFNIDVSTGSGSAQMTSCKVYYEDANPSTDVLQSLTISGTPTKTEYIEGDSFDPAGLTVTGTYSESGQKIITSGIVWTIDPETLTTSTTSVTVTAKVGSIESEEYIVNGISVKAPTPSFTWDSREQSYKASETEVGGISFADGTIITGAFDKGTGSNAPKYYLGTTGDNTTGAVRLYAGGSLTLTAANGYKICAVKFGFGQGDKTNTISVNNGTFSTDTWSGLASSVVFSIDGTSGHRRFQTIEVSYEEADPTCTVEITSVGWATACIPFDATVEGATAYYVTVDKKEVILNKIEGTIPAETGVVLKGEPGTATFTLSTDTPESVDGNLLVGTTEAGGKTFSAETGTTYYILSNGANGVGFYYDNETHDNGATAKCAQYKAVLAVPTGSGAPSFFTFDDATAINGISSMKASSVRYNLNGQAVGEGYKGIVIVNGKKMFNK